MRTLLSRTDVANKFKVSIETVVEWEKLEFLTPILIPMRTPGFKVVRYTAGEVQGLAARI